MASGRPDWYGSMSMHGKFGDLYKPVAVDAEGNLIATMYGGAPGARHYIAVDDDGIMKANLALQEAAFLTVRPAYGSAQKHSFIRVVFDDDETQLFEIEGQGVVYDGLIFTNAGDTPNSFVYRLYVDDVQILNMNAQDILFYGFTGLNKFPMSMSVYDTTDHKYYSVLNSIITFESKFAVKIYQNTGGNVTVEWIYHYALTP